MGINPSYTNEWKGAKRIADKMGIGIQFAKVAQSGHTDFLESPIKNALILAMMVDAGLKQGITQYSLGSARDETVDTLDSMASLSDAAELYELLETYYKQYIPGFKLVNTVENEKQSYQTILNRDADLLRYTVSCMTPYRFQKHLRRSNAKKYGVALTKGCGLSCFKCCHEALVLDKAGITKLPPKAREKCLAEIQAYDKRAGRTHTINRWI